MFEIPIPEQCLFLILILKAFITMFAAALVVSSGYTLFNFLLDAKHLWADLDY